MGSDKLNSKRVAGEHTPCRKHLHPCQLSLTPEHICAQRSSFFLRRAFRTDVLHVAPWCYVVSLERMQRHGMSFPQHLTIAQTGVYSRGSFIPFFRIWTLPGLMPHFLLWKFADDGGAVLKSKRWSERTLNRVRERKATAPSA